MRRIFLTLIFCLCATSVFAGPEIFLMASKKTSAVSPCPGYQSGNNCTWPAGTYTYTVPSGTTSINILAKGGGGGGNDDFCDTAGTGGDTTITYLSVVKATAFGGFGGGLSGDGTESGTLGSEVNTTGGGGAGGAGDTDCGSPAGNGGKVSGTLAVTAGNTVTVVVGSGGSANNDGSGGATNGADGSVVITW